MQAYCWWLYIVKAKQEIMLCLISLFFLLKNDLFCQQPSCAETSKKFTYFLVKTGNLVLRAQSDLRGYTPGQIIKLSTEIYNKSGKDTGYILASLIQVGKRAV